MSFILRRWGKGGTGHYCPGITNKHSFSDLDCYLLLSSISVKKEHEKFPNLFLFRPFQNSNNIITDLKYNPRSLEEEEEGGGGQIDPLDFFGI